jgi:astacin (peptidase family M12A)/Kelch motif protein
VIDGSLYRWPGGVVPYEIDAALPNQARVTQAIAHIEANTPSVDLIPRSGQADYVRFIPSTVCSSSVGRIGGRQLINLANGCDAGSTVHEITHALGLWHEQSRCDRGGFVEILWANIQTGKEHNFDSYCMNATDLYAYAEGSIMHYGPYAFSANGQPTIRSLRGLDNLMGQRIGYGSTDIATINQLYPPNNTRWVTRATMLTPRKQLAASVLSGVLYTIGGVNAAGTVLTKVEAYNPSTNTWTTKTSLPSARWRTSGAATINSVLYVAGGLGAGTTGHTKTLYAFNAGSNSWSTKAPMPAAGGCGASWPISGILYVMIGCDGTTTPTTGGKGILLRYDPGANTWSTKATAPGAHQYPGVAGVGASCM